MEPVCPDCGWRLLDDVYYQVREKKVYPLEVFIDNRKYSMIGKKIQFPELPVYPRSHKIYDEKWAEVHYCPDCEKEFTIIIEEE